MKSNCEPVAGSIAGITQRLSLVHYNAHNRGNQRNLMQANGADQSVLKGDFFMANRHLCVVKIDPQTRRVLSCRDFRSHRTGSQNLQNRGIFFELKFQPQHGRRIIRCAGRLVCFEFCAVSPSSRYSQEKKQRKTQERSRFLQKHSERERFLAQKHWISGAA
jgi:hypothetical protein